MAKQQTFGNKAGKVKQTGVNVKVVSASKTVKGTFKFNEKFVKLDDIAKVTEIK